MPSGSTPVLRQLVSQTNGLADNAHRPEVPQLQGPSGGIASDGLITGLSNAIPQQATNGQAGAGLRHVLTETNAMSPTTLSGDRYIGNPGGSGINGKHQFNLQASDENLTNTVSATSPEPGIQRTAGTILPARPSAEIPPTSPSAPAGLSQTSSSLSDQVTAPTAVVSSHGIGSASRRQPAMSGSACEERIAASGEAPSGARPSSLSADSISTSSSTSTSRTGPDSPRPRSQAASPDLHGGLSAAAGTPATPSDAIAHDKDSRKPTSATQAKAHSKECETLDNNGSAASQAAATPSEPLRHRHKRSPGQVLAPATSSSLGIDDTKVAAAVLVAQVCMTWRAMASAFAQAMSTSTSCRSKDRDCQSLSVSRTVLSAC